MAISEAIRRYRVGQGYDGPAVPRPGHARPVRAGHPDRRRGPRRRRRRRPARRATTGSPRRRPCPTRSSSPTAAPSRAGRPLADGIVVTPSHNPPDDGGFKYNPPNGGPADTDVTTWIQDEANRILDGQRSGRDRRHRAHPVRARARVDDPVRLPGHVRRRPAERGRPGGRRRLRAAHRRRPDGRRLGRLLGGHRRAPRPGPDRHQRRGRPGVRVHDPRLGRQDPDGPVVAGRDGPTRRAARPVRPGHRQRRRCRPPRRGHAGAAGC